MTSPWSTATALTVLPKPERQSFPVIRRSVMTRELADPKVQEQLKAYRNAVYKALRFLSNQIGKLDRTVVTVRHVRRQGSTQLEEERTPDPFHAITLLLGKGARAQPNPWQTSGNYLTGLIVDLGLTGNHYALKVRAPDGDEVHGFVRLRPDWTKVIPDDREGIAGYTFRPGGVMGRPLIFNRSEIVHTKTANPLDDRIGFSTLRAMAYGADLGEEIRRHQWQFFEQGARIDGIVQGVKQAQEIEKVYDLLRAGHYQGPDTAWLPLVLPAGLTFTPTEATAKDFEFAALAQFSEDDIFEAFGVPRALVGNVKDVSLANLRGLMVVAAENGIRPMTRIIEEHLESQVLGPDFEAPSQTFLEFDFDDPTPGDPDQERNQMEADLKNLVLSVNEVRSERGLAPVAWGEEPWIPINLMQPGDVDDEDTDDEDDDDRGEGEPDPDLLTAWRLAPGSTLHQLYPATGVRQTDLTLSLVDEALRIALGEEADRELIRRLRPLLLAALTESAEHTAGLLTVSPSVLAGHPAVETYLAEHVPKLVRVNDWTRSRVRNLVGQGVAEGQPTTAITKALRQQFRAFRTGRRGITIARTEAGIAWHTGSYEQMRDVGTAAAVWITSRDLRVRESHRTMDNQCRKLAEPFDTGAGNQLRYPHDPAGPAAEIVSCRCVHAPVPGGCAGRSKYLQSDTERAVYWRQAIAAMAPHERAVLQRIRQLFLRQERAFFAALGTLRA